MKAIEWLQKEVFMPDEMLKKEIARIYLLMAETDPQSNEYQVLIEELERLEQISCNKFTVEVDEKKNKYDNRVKVGVELAALGIMYGFNWIWMRKGFRFEENRTFDSTTFRWWLNQLKTKARFK